MDAIFQHLAAFDLPAHRAIVDVVQTIPM